MIFVFTPMLVRLWAAQAHRGAESFPAGKMALGCAFMGFGQHAHERRGLAEHR
jgi:dipeptide/tripeptide permease